MHPFYNPKFFNRYFQKDSFEIGKLITKYPNYIGLMGGKKKFDFPISLIYNLQRN